jgi:hypothetical protein
VQRSPEQSSDGDADASSPWPRFSEPGFNAHGQTNAPRNRVPRRRRRKLPVASVLRTGVQMPTNNPTLPGTEFRWRRRRKLPVASVLGTGGSMPTAKTNAPRNRVPRRRRRKLPVASVLRTGVQCPRPNQRSPEQSSDGDADASSPWPRFSEPGFNTHDQTNAPRTEFRGDADASSPWPRFSEPGVQCPRTNQRSPEQSSEATQKPYFTKTVKTKKRRSLAGTGAL